MALLKKRLFVGNLPSQASEFDVRKRLSRFGNVQSVEMKQRSDSEGNVLSSFAFVDIETNANELDNCYQYFGNKLWHNQKVSVQLAKESFLERLKREQKSAKNVPECATKTENDIAADVKNLGRTGKLQVPHDLNVSKENLNATMGETHWKKNKSPHGSSRSPSEKGLSKFESYVGAVNEREQVINKGRNGVQSRGNGLPMFGGTKLILGLEDIEVSDNLCGIQSHELRNLNDRGTKFVSPGNNKLPRFSKTEVINSMEVSGKVSDGGTKATSKKNRNLPMVRGSKTVIDAENFVKVEDAQCDSTHHKIKNRDLKCDGENLGSEENSVYPSAKIFGNVRNPQNQHSVQDSRSEVKPECKSKVDRIVPVSPSRITEKHSSISHGRSPVKPEHDLMAERKRLNALEERKKAFALQKEAVKKALSSIDLKNCSNKKNFDDEDDDQVLDAVDKEKRSATPSDESKPKLFEDSSDDEDIKKLESAEFKVKPQFEGHEGQKLLKIQSQYGNDSRFALDERFLESDEEGSSKDEPPPAEDLNAEKDHQLSILKEMLGFEVSPRKPRWGKIDKRNSIEMVRFDPTNPEHSKYVVKEEGDLKKKRKAAAGRGKEGGGDLGTSLPKKAKGGQEEEDPPLQVVMERFYKVSDNLKESLKKNIATCGKKGDDAKQEGGSGGFSLLQKFGSPPSDNEDEEVEYSTKPITRNHNEWEKNPFRYESSEEENDELETPKQSEGTSVKSGGEISEEQSHIFKGVTETFYFQENDPRLQEGLDFFGIKKTFAEMQEGFHEKRADLKLIIKAKVRNVKRRNRPLKKKLGGARRHKKKMSIFGSKI